LTLASNLCLEKGKPLFPVLVRDVKLPIQLAGLVWTDYRDIVTTSGHIRKNRLADLARELVAAIRHRFRPDQDVLQYFSPENEDKVALLINRSYATPFVRRRASTTGVFQQDIGPVLSELVERRALAEWKTVEVDRTSRRSVRAYVNGAWNIISYASSKINVGTALILDRIERERRLCLRFVFEHDLKRGRKRSSFPNYRKGVQVAILFQDAEFRYAETEDHGLILRVLPTTGPKRTWWVLAGCGRPGSVAARRLVLDAEWRDYLWPSIRKESSFVALFRVLYRASASDQPYAPELVSFRALEEDR